METWKQMELYPKYEVSTEGRVRNSKTHYIYAQQLSRTGYLMMDTWIDGKKGRMSVHRMVAMCYIPNPDNLPEVNHKNKIKTDNRPENLEWVTRQQNIDHRNADPKIQQLMHEVGCRNGAEHARKTAKPVACYDLEGNLIKIYPSLIAAEREGGINRKYIRMCMRGERQSAGGRVWKKVEGSTTIPDVE